MSRSHLTRRRTHRVPRALLAAASAVAFLGLAAPASQAAVPPQINFAPAGALVPAGYVTDSGEAYTAARGYGWVRQDSLSSATHVPLDMTTRMRERNAVTDQRLDTIAQAQTAPGSPALAAAAWEADVPTGDYTVTVGVGDPSYLDSTHRARVEGVVAINAFTPTSANRSLIATVTARVTDGKLTLDAIGGNNTKFAFITITPVNDTTAPAAPAGTAATPGDGQVSLSWSANGESDLAGYRVFRSTASPVDPATATQVNPGLLSTPSYTDTGLTNGTTYYYAVTAEDAVPNRSGAGNEVSATPAPAPPGTGFDRKINFQPAAAAVPAGYTADTGLGYDGTRGFGWVRQDSLSSATHVALDTTTRTRERNANADQRLDTLNQLQTAPGGTTLVPSAWEIAVPSGQYTVTVAAGDASYLDSTHRVRVEGTVAINNVTPTAANRFPTATVAVTVTDGRLTLDAIGGGSNTKIDYVDISSPAGPATPPPAPANVVATAGDASVALTWSASTGATGYDVYRSTAPSVVPSAATKLNTSQITGTSYTDTSAANGTTYYYVVLASDAAGNQSAPSSEVSATPAAAPVLPPDAPTGVSATAATGQINIAWAANAPANLAGYRVYRSTSSPVDTTTSLNTALITGTSYADTTAVVGTTYNYVVVAFNTNGDASPASAEAQATLPEPPAGYSGKINFQPAGAPVPAGYTADTGAAYANGSGWVREDSLATSTHVPLDVSSRTRDRNVVADQRQDTIVQLQTAPGSAALVAAAWEIAVPNGQYTVTVGVGDPSYIDSTHRARVEGVVAIAGFTPTSGNRFATGTVTVPVYDGRLTIDAVGGVNSKFDYADITYAGAIVPPAAPTNLVATAADSQVGLTWSAVTGAAGYSVYRSTSSPVATTPANKLNTNVITGTSYTDTSAVNGTAYTYVVVAVDGGGTESVPSAEASATPQPQPPLAPAGLTATAGAGQVNLAWNANAAAGLAGYRVYRSTDTPVPTTPGTQLNASLITGTSYADTTAALDTPYHYVITAVNTAGQESPVSNQADVTLTSAPTIPPKINFQPATAPVPAGYVADIGQPFSATRGYGWVRQDSLSATTHVPLDITSRPADRNASDSKGVPYEQRLDTVMPMQPTNGTPAAWEAIVPNGTYEVTAAVGDASFQDSIHRLRVEGVVLTSGYAPISTAPFRTATVRARVYDGVLTIDAIAGTNTKLDYLDITQVANDTTAPAAPTGIRNSPGNGRVSLNWAANTEADVVGYDVYRSTTTPVAITPANKLNTAHLPGTSYTDATAVNGTTYRYAVVAVDTVENVSAKSSDTTSTPTTVTEGGTISVSNTDPAPYPDRLIFNRIGSLTAPADNGVHDRSATRITNTGTSTLRIDSLSVSGNFQLLDAPALPIVVAPGSTQDIKVRFVATSGRISNGTLTIGTSDPATPTRAVQLSGYWQRFSEQNQEPTLQEIAQIFGYTTTITGPGQQLNRGGRSEAVGDEVLSPYWQRLDTSKQVSVTQLAALHNQGNIAVLYAHPRGSRTLSTLTVHAGIDGQSFLPHRNGSTTAFTQTNFTPPAAQFGWKIDSEWSDPLYNNVNPDRLQGCLTGCGHHMRFWPVKDRDGNVVAGTYLMSMDYSGINYDYQDNVFLVTNIAPVPQTAMLRVDVGNTGSYTDTLGNVWGPDTGLFSLDTTVAEGGTAGVIANTDDDRLYSTYRALQNGTALADRYLTFRVPEPGITTATVRLHYAERYWTAPQKRLFDLYVEGQTIKTNYDLFVEAGGQNKAFVLDIPNVAIRDGYLDITEKTLVDYAALNAIEVIPNP